MTVFRAVVAARATVESPTCDLSTTARLLLFLLAAHANGAGESNPSVPRLARMLGVTPATARRARAELVAAGAIRVDVSRGGRTTTDGRRRTNRYRVPLATVPQLPQPARQRAGMPSTTRAPARAISRNPRASARKTRAPARDEVVNEVAREKRSATTRVARRRERSFAHPVYRGAVNQ